MMLQAIINTSAIQSTVTNWFAQQAATAAANAATSQISPLYKWLLSLGIGSALIVVGIGFIILIKTVRSETLKNLVYFLSAIIIIIGIVILVLPGVSH